MFNSKLTNKTYFTALSEWKFNITAISACFHIEFCTPTPSIHYFKIQSQKYTFTHCVVIF